MSTVLTPRPSATPADVAARPAAPEPAPVGRVRVTRRHRTRAVRAGIATEGEHGAVVPPLHLSSNFAFEAFDKKRPYDYSRSGNPTRSLLADAIADLEGAAGSVITSSGMSAVTLVLQLVKPGETVVCAHDCYGGTWRLLRSLADRGALRVALVDLTAADAADRIRACSPRLVWFETPSNPLLRITNIAAVAAEAHACGALVVVDNTFLSPVLQRPIEHGADIVVHSTTKYLNGHSDVVGGAVVARDAVVHQSLDWWANCLGVTGAPFDAYLTLRGIRTLHPRLALHESNARIIAERLAQHDAVAVVHYPGLVSHPGHALAAAQQDGFGAMLSIELHGGREAARATCDALRCFTLAESLGGVESLVAHPATMTHASMDPAARAAAGITEGLLRFSIGIEDPEDLSDDLETALDAALRAGVGLHSVGAR